jgi:hypothetical protein
MAARPFLGMVKRIKGLREVGTFIRPPGHSRHEPPAHSLSAFGLGSAKRTNQPFSSPPVGMSPFGF